MILITFNFLLHNISNDNDNNYKNNNNIFKNFNFINKYVYIFIY